MIEILVFLLAVYLAVGGIHYYLWQRGGGHGSVLIVLIWPLLWVPMLSELWDWVEGKLKGFR